MYHCHPRISKRLPRESSDFFSKNRTSAPSHDSKTCYTTGEKTDRPAPGLRRNFILGEWQACQNPSRAAALCSLNWKLPFARRGAGARNGRSWQRIPNQIFSEGVNCMEHPFHLRYRTPASAWQDAMPLGNGRLGAMVYGHTGLERIQLNDDSLWYGAPMDRNNASLKEKLPEIRRLIFSGDIHRAEELIMQYMAGTPGCMRHYSTLGHAEPGAEPASAVLYRLDSRQHRCRGLRKRPRSDDRRVHDNAYAGRRALPRARCSSATIRTCCA